MSLGGRWKSGVSACPKGMEGSRRMGFLSTGKDDLVEEGSQEGSSARSNAMSVIVLLIILNLDGAGSEPKGRQFKR